MSRLQNVAAPAVNLDRAGQPEWLDATSAAAMLGVSRATLYAYVSRGRLASHTAAGASTRRYRRAEVEALAARQAGGHTPRVAARATLDWGLPVLNSGLTLIERGRCHYRGHDVLVLAEHASLEDVAALLWLQPEPGAMSLVHRHVHTVTGVRPRAGEALHEHLARAWSLGAAERTVLRGSLVLSADHELNASSFAVRCVASTGADLPACLTAGLAALGGPRHGGMTARVESLWGAWVAARRPLLARWTGEAGAGATDAASQDGLPGFGHPLYPQGDPRARWILEHLPPDPRRARLLARVREATGLAPSLDFALVALRRRLGLPSGAAFDLFATARMVGWIAHALEQRLDGRLIRPRAHYTGPPPATAAAPHGRIVRRR